MIKPNKLYSDNGAPVVNDDITYPLDPDRHQRVTGALSWEHTPVFFIRDLLKFPDFIHTQKRNPKGNEAAWQFWLLNPESYHQVLILLIALSPPMCVIQMVMEIILQLY